MQDRVYKQEPYMGMIGATRWQSTGSNLFASPLKNHNGIRITIKTGRVCTDLGRDWYSGDKTIVEVDLSPAQWAELLTNMNVGDGVPCTIGYRESTGLVQPHSVPDPEIIPHDDNTAQEALGGVRHQFKEVLELAKSLSSKGKAGKKDLDNLVDKLGWAILATKSNFDFADESIRKRIGKYVSAAKNEIAATMENIGLRHVHNQIEQARKKELE